MSFKESWAFGGASTAEKQAIIWGKSTELGNQLVQERYPQVFSDPALYGSVSRETDRLIALKKQGSAALSGKLPEDIIVLAVENVLKKEK